MRLAQDDRGHPFGCPQACGSKNKEQRRGRLGDHAHFENFARHARNELFENTLV